MRLLLGLLAGQQVEATLTGDASLQKRPMERVADPLRRMGARIETENGHAPVKVHAVSALDGIRYELPVASAQIKSALLLAGLGAHGRTELHSPAPSRDHTERMLRMMGVPVAASADGLVVTLDGPCELNAARIAVPGDLSSAAFFIVGACIGATGPVLIRNVGVNPSRDGVLTILGMMGARIELENQAALGEEPVADLRIYPSKLRGIEIPEELIPLAIDELPVLFVAAAAADGQTRITGAAELRVKESDRIGVMARALSDTGIQVEELPDGIVIDGGEFAGGAVDSCGDHRVAMSFAVASLVSSGTIEIADTGPVATSFPGFVETAASAGLAIDMQAA
jgi:3-phosphoshikimate 1-carboxyvinyltransferase